MPYLVASKLQYLFKKKEKNLVNNIIEIVRIYA